MTNIIVKMNRENKRAYIDAIDQMITKSSDRLYKTLNLVQEKLIGLCGQKEVYTVTLTQSQLSALRYVSKDALRHELRELEECRIGVQSIKRIEKYQQAYFAIYFYIQQPNSRLCEGA